MAGEKTESKSRGSIPVIVKGIQRAILYLDSPSAFIWGAGQSCKGRRLFLPSLNGKVDTPWQASFIAKDADEVFKYVIANPRDGMKDEVAEIRDFAGEQGVAGRLRISETGEIYALYDAEPNPDVSTNYSLWLNDVQALSKNRGLHVKYSLGGGVVFHARQGIRHFLIALDNNKQHGRTLDNALEQLKEQKPVEVQSPILQGIRWYDDLAHAYRA